MGNIFVYTGTGMGKTTAAIGLAIRAIGQGKKVTIIQFMKGRKDIGEYKICKKLGSRYDIRQFGREGWVDLKRPSTKDILAAHLGMKFAEEALRHKPDLLILDEINLATKIGLVKEKDVLALLRKLPAKTDLVLTGRFAPKSFINISDAATEMKIIKSPKKFITKKGITY